MLTLDQVRTEIQKMENSTPHQFTNYGIDKLYKLYQLFFGMKIQNVEDQQEEVKQQIVRLTTVVDAIQNSQINRAINLLEKTTVILEDHSIKMKDLMNCMLDLSTKMEFLRLYAIWKEQTEYKSYVDTNNEAYKAIIAMGPAVVPFILQDMEYRLEHWFHALNAITGIEVVTDDIAGNVPKMTEAWLKYAAEHPNFWLKNKTEE